MESMDISDKETIDVEREAFRRGMKCIKSLPNIRDKGCDGIVGKDDLKSLIGLLVSYLESPQKTFPSSKKLLHAAAFLRSPFAKMGQDAARSSRPEMGRDNFTLVRSEPPARPVCAGSCERRGSQKVDAQVLFAG